jgi:hypothetical protein
VIVSGSISLPRLGSEVLRPVEFDRCTAHHQRIAEMTSFALTNGARVTLDPPVLVHLRDDPLYGTLVATTCGPGAWAAHDGQTWDDMVREDERGDH